jgi:hypothetical protein
VERGASFEHQNRQGWMPISYSCTLDAQRYFEQLVQDREIRRLQAGASADPERARPKVVTPAPGRSDWTAAPTGRQRASSGS